MIIGKIFKFDSAHYLKGHDKCGAMHGHTYTLTVEVRGNVNPDTGMVIDFIDLIPKVQELINLFDHKVINDNLTSPSTVEELCLYFFYRLTNTHKLNIHSIQVQEGGGGYARKEK